MINPDKYRARVEKAKAQLKKSQAQAAKARRDVERLKPLYEQHAASNWIWITPQPPWKMPRRISP